MLKPLRSASYAVATALGVLAVAGIPAVAAQDKVELHGASQFDDSHAFNKTLLKFEEEVKACYSGEVDFILHRNSELGLEKEYFAYMSQGISVDYAIVAPSHMSTFSKRAPLMDMPFLFRDLEHWNKVLESNAFDPIAADVKEKADNILVGYAGGGTRNVFANKAIGNMDELKDLPMRVMGAPIQTRIFEAIGAAPSVIAYAEVYNAIQTGVIEGAENEAAGIEQMKFYEVGPNVVLTQHAITVRPLVFSGKTFARLPEALQTCVMSAGKLAGKFGRDLESSQDAEKLAMMESEGKLKTISFADREKLLELAEPVKKAYAEELGATDILDAVNAIE